MDAPKLCLAQCMVEQKKKTSIWLVALNMFYKTPGVNESLVD